MSDMSSLVKNMLGTPEPFKVLKFRTHLVPSQQPKKLKVYAEGDARYQQCYSELLCDNPGSVWLRA